MWQISALLVTALAVSALTYRLAQKAFNEVQDEGLEQIAHTVLRHDETPVPPRAKPGATVSTPPSPGSDNSGWQEGTDDTAEDEEDEGRFVSQIWSPSGDLIFSSLLDDGPPLQPPGFHFVLWQDHTWRTYTLARGKRTVQVAVTRRDRNQSFSALIPWLMVPMGLLVLLLGSLIHEAVSRALRPLEQLRHDIGQREVAELHAVDTTQLPDEVAPLAMTLNQLLARLDALLAGQRQFLADAAHELNTPLATIKLQAQMARRAGESERQARLDDLDAGIERAIHLTAQLLQLARLDPEERRPVRTPVALDTLVRQAVGALSAQADLRGTDLGVLQADAVTIPADPQALRALLDNLIDNALRYAPKGARVDVSLVRIGNEAVLQVSDNGPGISPADRARATERFVRLHPGNTTGSGLGLAIVRETAQLHGAALELDDTPGGGLTVRLRLPLDAHTKVSR
jgi:two-component system, OmpR family, sensor kinase